MRGLTGKVALVTGAARGIGLAIASRLAEEGAKIAIADINGDGATHAAERIGGAAMGVRVDVTDTASIAVGVAAVVERLGTIDVLVNNAGWDKVEPFVKSEEATWDTVIAINLKGPIACVLAVLDSMIERRSGKIVSISSDAGRVGSAGRRCMRARKPGSSVFRRRWRASSPATGSTSMSSAQGPRIRRSSTRWQVGTRSSPRRSNRRFRSAVSASPRISRPPLRSSLLTTPPS
jgi:2-hydroxycyclohexanecarboxyl-CoA dehydrogenase